MPITLSAGLFAFFAVIQDFQNPLGALAGRRILAGEVYDDFLPIGWYIATADQNGVFIVWQRAFVALMRHKAASPKGPKQLIDISGLFGMVGQYVAKLAAAVEFFDQLAGEALAFILRGGGQNVEADFRPLHG